MGTLNPRLYPELRWYMIFSLNRCALLYQGVMENTRSTECDSESLADIGHRSNDFEIYMAAEVLCTTQKRVYVVSIHLQDVSMRFYCFSANSAVRPLQMSQCGISAEANLVTPLRSRTQ